MIIFNFNAIAVGIIIAVICGPIYWLMPDQFANNPMGVIILASIATVLAGLSELGGLKGRLFFLPMWLLGLLGTIAYAFMEYSWKGIGVLGGAVVLLFGLFALAFYFLDKSDWENAPKHLLALKKMKNTEDKAFWERVDKAVFIPTLMNYNHRICAHNVEALTYLQSIGVNWEEIEILQAVFQACSVQGNDINIETEDTDAFEARLREVLEGFEEEEN